MIKFTQTKVSIHDSNKKAVRHGNCWQTTIASLIEIDPLDVPNFETWFDYKSNNEKDHSKDFYYNYFEMTMNWLESKGYKLDHANIYNIAFHMEKEPEWLWRRLENVSKSKSFKEYKAELRKRLKGNLYIVSGLSPRGNNIYHVCIYKNGKLFYDVHPSREGVLSQESFYSITKIP